jgi:hypothetical protein
MEVLLLVALLIIQRIAGRCFIPSSRSFPILLAFLLFALGLSGCIQRFESNSVNVSANEGLYFRTLGSFDEVHPGYGYDMKYKKEALNHPKAYALYASSEAHRFRETGDISAIKNAINAANWLVTNSDLDGDDEIGWGLPFSSDAGGDGSITPANTEYVIQTAIAIQALLDVYDAVMQSGYDADISEYPATSAEAMETFLNGCYDEDENGLAFWYSTHPEDRFHAINPTAMLAGQLQRLSRYPSVNQSRFSQTADKCILFILANRQNDSNGNPYWMYYEGEAPISASQNRPNDLYHEIFTLQGLFDYKINGGRYGNLVDVEKQLTTINRFINGSKVYELSVGYNYSDYWKGETERWARIWSVGYALHFAVRLESYLNETPVLSTKLFLSLADKYRKDGQWLLRPDDQLMPFCPRQMSFMLYGLSFYEFRNHTGECRLIDGKFAGQPGNDTYLQKPLNPFTTQLSSQGYLESFRRTRLDQMGVPEINYGKTYNNAGWQYSPFLIGNYALALYRDYLRTGDSAIFESFMRQVNWFIDHRAEREYQGVSFWVWKYNFSNPLYDAKGPWTSSLSQGDALCVFLAAYDLTNDPSYIRAAEYAFRSFLVPESAGGLTTVEGDAAWYEEVACEDSNSTKILNGHIIALQSLWTYWKWTGRDDVKSCLDRGIAAVRQGLAQYDAGFLSYYSQYPTSPRIIANPGGYNRLHSRQMVWLYEITNEPVFLEYALRFACYDSPSWNITAAGSTNPVDHGPDKLFFKAGTNCWSHEIFPTWVQIDLRETQVIDGFVFKSCNIEGTPRDFQVFGSSDGDNWTPLLERYGNNELSVKESFRPVRVRFVKLVILSSNDNKSVALNGIAVLRQNASPAAVSNWDSFSSSNLASRVFDQGWTTPGRGWLIVDMGEKPHGSILEIMGVGGISSYSFLGSNNLDSFVPFAPSGVETAKNDWMMTIIAADPRYMKIEFQEGSNGGKLRIRRG